MSCTACRRDLRIVGRGLCNPCYQRFWKRGTTEYAEKRARTFCHIDNCGKPVVTNGMCDMHRQRLRKHGDVHNAGPDDWGAKRPTGRDRHPLFNAWAYLRKHRGRHPVVQVWLDDFLQFVADVGEKPSPKHKLYLADDTKPMGPDNFIWKRSIIERHAGEDRKTAEARRARAMRKLQPDKYRGYDLKKHFGLSRDQYQAMLDAQDHRCAICLKEEGNIIRGVKLRLSVDHCHTSGHVRALLCANCNMALGGFRDDPALLRAAIAYLEKHSLPSAAK